MSHAGRRRDPRQPSWHPLVIAGFACAAAGLVALLFYAMTPGAPEPAPGTDADPVAVPPRPVQVVAPMDPAPVPRPAAAPVPAPAEPPPAQGPDPRQAAWDAAVALHKAGKPAEALAGLADLRRQDPGFLAEPGRAALLAEMERAALWDAAAALHKAGKPAEALASLADLRRQDPGYVAEPGRAALLEEMELSVPWDAAVALHKAGQTVEALAGLSVQRRLQPEFFAKPGRAARLADMERAALAILARAAEQQPLGEARGLAATLDSALLDRVNVAKAAALLAAAERRAVAAMSGTETPVATPELAAPWDAAVALHKAGQTVEALASLSSLRLLQPKFFAEPARAALLADMERAALVTLARTARRRPLEEACGLATTLAGALVEPANAAKATALLAAAERRAAAARPGAGNDIIARSTAAGDKTALTRHLERFGGRDPVSPAGDWVDQALGAVDAADRNLEAEPAPLPVADQEEAEQRRLDQLEKLRQRDALGLLDRIGGALAWLALHQGADGHFDMDATAAQCKALGHDGSCAATQGRSLPLAATGLAVIAFLDFRDQDAQGLFEPTLARGLAWLLAQQRPDGSFGAGAGGYPAAIGLMALGQAAASSGDPAVREAAKRGLAFQARHGCLKDGGYRYSLDDQMGDLSVTAWQVQAFEAARNAGLEVPDGQRERLDGFVAAVQVGPHAFCYTPDAAPQKRETRSLAPAGMLSLAILRPDLPPETLADWRAFLAKGPPAAGVYTLYYGIRVSLALDGRLDAAWRKPLDELAASQVSLGSAAGMIPLAGDNYFKTCGPAISTAFAALVLEHSLYRR